MFSGWAWGQVESRAVFLPKESQELRTPWLGLREGERRWQGHWWLGTGLTSFSEGKDEGAGGGAKIGADLRYRLAEWAWFVFDGEARFWSARVQARYDDDIMDSGLRLREGYVAFGVEDTFDVAVGGISQKVLRSDLLVSGRRSFPGVREKMGVGRGAVEVKAFAQQTVPTSYSLNSRRADREPMPSFLTETFEIKITPAKGFETEFYATHYRFNQLPAVVAFDSEGLGNSVTGDVPASSAFRYGFEGFLLGVEQNLFASGPLSFSLGGQWLQNTLAPAKSNRGQLLFVQSKLRFGQAFELVPRFSAFFNESDTSPAVYNRWDLGNNNRKGLIAELKVNFPRYGFAIEAEYVQSAMINPDPFQADRQFFFLGVETDHVPF